MNKRILIIGSSGMLGTDLSQELGEDYEVSGTDIVTSNKSQVTSFYNGDISDNKGIADIINRISPEFVIHAAAMTDVDGCEIDSKKAYEINGVGTKNIADACAKSGCALIYISTDFVFDGKKTAPYKESDVASPLSIYGDSKLKGEEAVKKRLKNYFILRTSWLYGKNGKNFVDTIVAKAQTEKVLRVVDDQVGTPTYTKDLSKAIRALLERVNRPYTLDPTPCGVYHVSNSGATSWYEYAKEILRLAGSATDVAPISSQELNRPARRPAMSVLDNSKFTVFTGYKMRDWRSALEEYMCKK